MQKAVAALDTVAPSVVDCIILVQGNIIVAPSALQLLNFNTMGQQKS